MMDPRLVLAVLERAADMVKAGTSHGRAIRDAVIALGHRPGPGDGETKTGRDLWIAALKASSIGEDRYRDAAARLASIRAGAAAIHSQILSVCLFCGAIAGALPIEARRLIAAYCAGDEAALIPLFDLARQSGWIEPGPLAQWAEERQGWLEVTGHEHVWLPCWRSNVAGEHRLVNGALRRCTCGMFEHETARPCADANCQREFGHPGLHMSRSWDAQAVLEIFDELGNVDEHARGIMQRYLDAQPDPLMSSFYDD